MDEHENTPGQPAGQVDPSLEPAPAGRLSIERIVDETLALIDSEGIASASMRTVANRLGVGAMSVYRHVANREALFDAVVERIVDELDADPDVADDAADGRWQDYLRSLAHGVRRYAIAHPHAFPLVATRPPAAPWINPPLRSLRWIESMLNVLARAGFDDNQILTTYRAFNSFLLGYLLLETSAVVLRDPKPGDGSFQTGDGTGAHDPVDPADPVPGALSPTRTTRNRHDLDNTDGAIPDTDGAPQLVDYPTLDRLQDGLSEDHYQQEFELGLAQLLDRITHTLTA